MKYLLSITTALLLSVFAFSQSESDLLENNLKGKIKSIESKTYRSKTVDGKLQLGGVTSESNEEYNNDGYYTSSSYRFSSRIMGKGAWSKTIYIRNKQNQVLTSTFSKDTALIEKVKNTYKKDILSQIEYTDGKGELLANVTQVYNKKGLLTESTALNLSGDQIGKTVYTYDKEGNITSIVKWKGESIENKSETTYLDENTTKTLKTNGEGKLISSIIEKHNSNNQVISTEKNIEKNNLKTKSINEYDQFGNKTLRRTFANGKEETYNYMRYEYTFDQHNNWIQKVEYLHNGNSLDVTKRTIEYY